MEIFISKISTGLGDFKFLPAKIHKLPANVRGFTQFSTRDTYNLELNISY